MIIESILKEIDNLSDYYLEFYYPNINKVYIRIYQRRPYQLKRCFQATFAHGIYHILYKTFLPLVVNILKITQTINSLIDCEIIEHPII